MKKFYRSTTDVVLGGVCGGLGRYLAIDPTLVRVAFVVFGIFSGVGLIAYFLLWIFVPREDGQGEVTAETIRAGADEVGARAKALGESLRDGSRPMDSRLTFLLGAILSGAGVLILLRNLDIPWLRWLNLHTLWPLLLIGAGLILIWRRAKGE